MTRGHRRPKHTRLNEILYQYERNYDVCSITPRCSGRCEKISKPAESRGCNPRLSAGLLIFETRQDTRWRARDEVLSEAKPRKAPRPRPTTRIRPQQWRGYVRSIPSPIPRAFAVDSNAPWSTRFFLFCSPVLLRASSTPS